MPLCLLRLPPSTRQPEISWAGSRPHPLPAFRVSWRARVVPRPNGRASPCGRAADCCVFCAKRFMSGGKNWPKPSRASQGSRASSPSSPICSYPSMPPITMPHNNTAVKAKAGWISFEPCGVIAVIGACNYPLAVPLGQIIPAIVAGNAAVLKPSELTPWCGALVGELFEQAGFPRDLVQVVQGAGELGEALINAGPDKVIFTGSVATGKRVAETCARRLIPCVLELGGKDAMIVLADADLEVTSSAAVWGSFTNCGQACLSVERIYVEHGIAEAFGERCAAKTRLLKLGPGMDPNTEVGPLIRASAVDRVEAELQEAVCRAARILAGGRRRPDLGPCFFEPTVVADVDHSMKLMQEETFGPVLAIRSVADADRLFP